MLSRTMPVMMLDRLDLLERIEDARAALEDDDAMAADAILSEIEDALIIAGRDA